MVIQGVEDEAEYHALVAEVCADLKPVGAVESLLAERVAQLFWRLRRVLRFETERLSQQSCEAASAQPTLDEIVRNGVRRERFCFALGHLFLSETVELEPEMVATIFEAFSDCLSGAQRLVFWETEESWMAAMRGPIASDAPVTVGGVLSFLHDAEVRVRALGPLTLGSPVLSAEKRQANLIAAVFTHYLSAERLWGRFDRETMRKFDMRLTDALLLQLGTVGLVDRYEPRLRKDLTNTLRDLANLQDRRRDSGLRTAATENRLPFAAAIHG